MNKELAGNPNDPALLLALAETIVRLFEMTGTGNLNRAIADARRAIQKDPEAAEALFWEARGQALAGRDQKWREMLTRLTERPARSKKHHELLRRAKALLALEDPAES